MAESYPLLEEIKLKRKVVSDEGLEMIGGVFGVLRNLRELDLLESEGEDLSGHWLSHFLDACTLLEFGKAIPGLNMSTVTSHMNMEVDTISDIDIRNNSLNENLRSATARHHHKFIIHNLEKRNYNEEPRLR
nr:hypothetical protein [Tanacetum cinerariifolium]